MAAVADTLEGMAFEQVELIESGVDAPPWPGVEPETFPGQEKGPPAPPARLWFCLPLSAPLRGLVAVELPGVYAAQIAGALYGPEEQSPQREAVRDTMGELLNTLAGRFMQELLGPDQNFELGFPRAGEGEMLSPDAPAVKLTFSAAGYPFQALLFGDHFVREDTFILQKEEVQL